MGLQHFAVGAALGVLLWGLLPATAGADGPVGSRFSGVRDHGVFNPTGRNSKIEPSRDPNGILARETIRRLVVREHGHLFDLLDLRDRFDPGAFERRRDHDKHPHIALWKLRKLVRIFVQKAVCHPRGKPPHGHFGWGGLTSVGFFPGAGFGPDGHHGRGHGDDGDHGDHGDHGHKPPFCPSPH